MGGCWWLTECEREALVAGVQIENERVEIVALDEPLKDERACSMADLESVTDGYYLNVSEQLR